MHTRIVDAKTQPSAAVYLNSSVVWDVTQRRLVNNRRFGTTYRSHLQGAKTEATGSPETSVINQPTLRNVPNDGRIQIR